MRRPGDGVNAPAASAWGEGGLVHQPLLSSPTSPAGLVLTRRTKRKAGSVAERARAPSMSDVLADAARADHEEEDAAGKAGGTPGPGGAGWSVRRPSQSPRLRGAIAPAILHETAKHLLPPPPTHAPHSVAILHDFLTYARLHLRTFAMPPRARPPLPASWRAPRAAHRATGPWRIRITGPARPGSARRGVCSAPEWRQTDGLRAVIRRNHPVRADRSLGPARARDRMHVIWGTRRLARVPGKAGRLPRRRMRTSATETAGRRGRGAGRARCPAEALPAGRAREVGRAAAIGAGRSRRCGRWERCGKMGGRRGAGRCGGARKRPDRRDLRPSGPVVPSRNGAVRVSASGCARACAS